jgi:tagatose-1,6-bisphosphate aldolase non-catalytic subunit AgaZ/GatZ
MAVLVLSRTFPQFSQPHLLFEANSTDYQQRKALISLVRNHSQQAYLVRSAPLGLAFAAAAYLEAL